MPDDNRDYHGHFKPGTILRDRYKILGGLGGLDALYVPNPIYLAQDLSVIDSEHHVVIKTDETHGWDTRLKVFHREAAKWAALNHPAITKIFDFWDQHHKLYLVMELVTGIDLEQLIRQNRLSLSFKQSIDYAIQICDVLDYLYNQQSDPIVFRRLLPENVMINQNSQVKLINFGITLSMEKAIPTPITDGILAWEEGYHPPEEFLGDIRPSIDIYQLGAILHHLLTGNDPRLREPFSFRDYPIKEYNPDVPDELVKVVEKAVEHKAKDRWQSAAEMKLALEQLM
jgi:eukaryotic-like serine/threonine-protein kinase